MPDEETIRKVLVRVGLALNFRVEVSVANAGEVSSLDAEDPLQSFLDRAEQAGIFLKETSLASVDEALGFVQEAFPVILAYPDGSFVTVESASGRRLEITVADGQLQARTITRRGLRSYLRTDPAPRSFVAKKELECDQIASAADHGHGGHGHDHPSPLRRFLGLLDFDRRDIGTVILFASVAGVLTLATPLAVESLVNVVSWGTYIQPLIVLGMMLLICLGLAGVLRLLQIVVVELIQRRQFVRVVGDLAHRFPRANQAALAGVFPRELANRVFDIMTIQKATAVLLVDGVSIVLTTFLGMVLLAFYHPFLLGFDLILLFAMTIITWILGRGGIRTAIDESITKYAVAHWLQDVFAAPTVFKTGGGERLAVERANQLSAQYIHARQQQFRVVIRQIAFAIALQVFASTAVLGLGGWLVIQGQLTLGQLVASELVVTLVVGAFAKAGKALEKFYDLMAGVDKVGYLIDVRVDPRQEVGVQLQGPAEVRWGALFFQRGTSQTRIAAATIPAGGRVAIVGDDVDGRSDLAKTLGGLREPTQGFARVGGYDAEQAAIGGAGLVIGYAGGTELFHGTLRENIAVGRPRIGPHRIREVLGEVGLLDRVLNLEDGLHTHLQSDGYPLSRTEVTQLILARAMAAAPSLLIIDGLLDQLAADQRETIWSALVAFDAPWTLLVVTNRDDVASWCDSQIAIRRTSTPSA